VWCAGVPLLERQISAAVDPEVQYTVLTGIFNGFLLILYVTTTTKATRSLAVTVTSWAHTDVRCPCADVDSPLKTLLFTSPRRQDVHLLFKITVFFCINAARREIVDLLEE
jgi:hypothetical protein